MRPGAIEYTPIFNWSQARSRKVSLISFIAASALLHAFCFYIFQIIYPPTIALLPPPARVNVITADSEEGRVLLRWIEAEDPALTSITQRTPEAGNLVLPKTEHVPSYAARQPVLKALSPLQPNLDVPSSAPPAPVPLTRESVSPSPALTATEITFSSSGALGKPVLPRPEFKTSRKEPPQAAEFRIAIDAQGEVRFCFLENSSGDQSLDAQAAHHLLSARFPAIENDLTWAGATFEWGNDLATAESRASAP